MDFIEKHIHKKIEENISDKQSKLNHYGFYWFNDPIIDGNIIIDRFNQYNPFIKNKTSPTTWYRLSKKSLMEAYFKIKNNQLYIYKLIENKMYKNEIKNDTDI
jgi:hypothetical protein